MKFSARRTAPLALIVTLFASSCGNSADKPVVLPDPEMYNWGGQPISISSPPEGWYREKTQQGGLRGARFIKSGSVGEEIRLAEHYALDERDRCARIEALLHDIDTLQSRDFLSELQRAKLYASPAINRAEARYANIANDELDLARSAYLQKNNVEAREAITAALEHAARIRYALDDVLERVMFSADSYDSFGKVEVQAPTNGWIDDEPSVSIDFTLDSRDRKVLFYGRQVYVLRNNRLFVLAFLGLPENLPMFDKIVDSVSFPPSACEH